MAPHQFAFILVNIILLTFLAYELCSAVQLKLTNMECETLDQNLIKFRECRLKFIRRGIIAANIYMELFKTLDAIEVNFAIYKKANGYKPFLYNATTDFCEFMGKSSKDMLSRILYNFVAEYSNFNHTCPYTGALILKNFLLTEDKFRLIPLPSGEYMLNVICSSKGQRLGMVRGYFSRIE